jgi:hypothetical protein
MTKKPEPKDTEPGGYKDATGPIPLDDFGNDIPVTDRPNGPLYDFLDQKYPKKPADKK